MNGGRTIEPGNRGISAAADAPASRKLGLFRIAVLALTVISISRAHSYFPLLSRARPAVLLVLLASFYALLQPGRVEFVNLKRSRHAWVLGIFVVVACLSIPFGISMGRAGKFLIEDYWKTLLLYPLLLLTVRSVADVRRIVWALVIAGGLLVWLSLFVFGISKTQGAFGYDANDIGCVLITVLPLTLLAIQTSKGWHRLAALAVMIGIGATLAHSESRGAFVGLLAVGAVILVTLRSVSVFKRLALVITVGIALALSASPAYWAQIRTLRHPEADYNWQSAGGRKALATRAIGYMWAYPVFGIGINNFPRAEVTISPRANEMLGRGERISAMVTHNTHIQVLSEMGLTGSAVWVALWLTAFVSIFRLRFRLPRSWAKGSTDERFLYFATYYVPVAMFGFLLTATFVSFAYHDLTYVLGATAAAVPLAGNRQEALAGAGHAGSVDRVRTERGRGSRAKRRGYDLVHAPNNRSARRTT